MLDRHIAFYGRPVSTISAGPRPAAAFHKKAGLNIEDMVKSLWVYRKLRNFRAGIEAGISCLKRAYGLARCFRRARRLSDRTRA